MTLNTDDFVRELARTYKYTIKDADMIVSDFESMVLDIVRRGDKLHLHGFLDFDVVENKSKNMVSIKDGSWIKTVPRLRIRVNPLYSLKCAVAECDTERKRQKAEAEEAERLAEEARSGRGDY